MADFELLDCSPVEGSGVLVVRLNRPQKLNAFNRTLLREFAQAMRDFEASDSFVAVVTGTGRAFTAGRDVKEATLGGSALLDADLGPDFNPFWMGKPTNKGYVRTLEKPVIAAVNGIACGMGLSLALAADICIASEDATFELSEVHHGIPSGWRIGIQNGLSRSAAVELAFGERVSARRAYDMGFVNRVTEPDDLIDTAIDWGKRLARLSRDVVRAQLELVSATWPVVGEEIDARGDVLRGLIRQSELNKEAQK